jgi:hypothetical protein
MAPVVKPDSNNPNRTFLRYEKKEDLALLTVDTMVFPLAWGEQPGGAKFPKVELRVRDPTNPADPRLHCLLIDVTEKMNVRASDVNTEKPGKASMVVSRNNWLVPLDGEYKLAADRIDEAMRRSMCSLKTARVLTRGTEKGDKAWDEKEVPSKKDKGHPMSVAEFTLGGGTKEAPNDFFKEVWEAQGLGKKKVADLSPEEATAFEEALYLRTRQPRDPDAEADDAKGKKPWIKSLQLAPREAVDGGDELPTLKPAYAMAFKNFVKGAPVKKKGTEQDLEQTSVWEYKPTESGAWDEESAKKISVDEALQKLTFHSGGREGLPKTSFVIEWKLRFSFKHLWLNNTGGNPLLQIDTLYFCIVSPQAGNVFDDRIGGGNGPNKVKREEPAEATAEHALGVEGSEGPTHKADDPEQTPAKVETKKREAAESPEEAPAKAARAE